MATDADQRVERYLDGACRALRASGIDGDARRELRAHLEALIAESMLAGTPRRRAVDEALRLMGAPAAVSRAFRISLDVPALVPAIAGYAQRPAREREHRMRRALAWALLAALTAQAHLIAFMYLRPA